jgi:hypothetical protein
MMKKYPAIISLLLLIASQAHAEQYDIHLDTSESSNLRNYEALSIYGEVYTIEATTGFTTTLIGPFESKKLAGETLNKIRNDGYFGAFLIKHENERSKMKATDKHESINNETFKDLTANKVISRL